MKNYAADTTNEMQKLQIPRTRNKQRRIYQRNMQSGILPTEKSKLAIQNEQIHTKRRRRRVHLPKNDGKSNHSS